MLKTINSDGSLKIALIGSAVPAGAVYNDGLAYAPDGSLYVKLTQGALSGQVYNGGLACTPDGALYVANSTPAASATFRRGLLCRADGTVHVSDATVATVRHDGGIPKDNAGRLFVGIPLAGLSLATDAATGVTSSGGFASAWADLSGNGRNLLQATGANQPIHLPFAGTKYARNFGVASNYFSTPNAAANQLNGDKTIIVLGLKLASVAPAGYSVIYSKGAVGFAHGFELAQDAGTGKLSYSYYTGITLRTALSTVTLASVGIAAATECDLAVTHDSATGSIKFWYKLSGGAWTQLGGTVAGTAGTATTVTADVSLFGRVANPTLYNNDASCTRAKLYDGVVTDLDVGTGGTLKQDMTPNAWTSGATFVSSTTSETYTIVSTGAKPAQIVDRASLLFDGAAHFMKCSAFTLNQPDTVYLVGTQYVWNSGDYLFDGNALNGGGIIQATGTPQINLNAGSSVAGNTEMTLAARKVVCAVFNGASSSLQVTTGTATTGNAGAGNMGGFTLGAAGSNLLFGNLQANDVLIYNTAHDAATRANVIRALMSEHGVS